MRDRGYRIEGIVIKRINFSEADKIITIFSKQKGKIVVLAKGIRKISSRRGPCLELFNQVKAYVVNGKGMDLLAEVELVADYSCFSKKLSTINSAFYLSELVDRLTAEHQQNLTVYQLLTQSLKNINDSGNLALDDFIDFQKDLLTCLGFGLPRQVNCQTLQWHIESIISRKINTKYIKERP